MPSPMPRPVTTSPLPRAEPEILGVQAAAMVVVPKTTDSPPPTEWPKQEIAVETLHHLVYAAAAGAAYAFLDRSDRKAA